MQDALQSLDQEKTGKTSEFKFRFEVTFTVTLLYAAGLGPKSELCRIVMF